MLLIAFMIAIDGNSEFIESLLTLQLFFALKAINLAGMCKAFIFEYKANSATFGMHDWR